MARDLSIRAEITADDKASAVIRNFGQSIGHAETAVGGIDKALGTLARGALAGATIGLGAATAVGYSLVKSFGESEQVTAQLNAVLKSTKGVAGVTAKAAEDLATSLQKVTTYSDEEILSAENLLLTFTKINKKIFPETTKLALDMSAALGQDLKSSSIQLGKALQDPIDGVTALRRVGVNFSDAQRDVIKRLVETGQSAKAQEIILEELRTEFGGSAEAAGTTFVGSLKRLNNQIDTVKERFGELLVKALAPFVEKLANFVSSDKFAAWADEAATKLQAFIDKVIAFLRDNKQAIIDAFVNLGNAIKVTAELVFGLTKWFYEHKLAAQILTGVVLALTAAYVALKIALAITAAISAVNVAIGKATATTALATTTVRGLIGALGGLAAVASVAIVLAVGVGAIIYAITKVNELNKAWSNAHKSMAQADLLEDNLIRKIQQNPNLSKEEKSRRIRALQNDAGAPGRAIGGNVTMGQPYVVGEKRPELFVPNQSGKIIPRVNTNNSATINITVQAGAFMGNPADARKYARLIADALKDVAGAKGQTAAQMLGS